MKRILALLALGGLIIAVIINAKDSPASLAEEADNFSQEKVQGVQENTKKQIAKVSDRVKEVGEQAKKVLGVAVKINEEEDAGSIQQKAVEYGQYLYCKQVVDNYKQ